MTLKTTVTKQFVSILRNIFNFANAMFINIYTMSLNLTG